MKLWQRKETITVLMVEPGENALHQRDQLRACLLQHEVGGRIEALYPFEEPVAIVCNEEGKMDGLPLNRALRDGDGEVPMTSSPVTLWLSG